MDVHITEIPQLLKPLSTMEASRVIRAPGGVVGGSTLQHQRARLLLIPLLDLRMPSKVYAYYIYGKLKLL